MTADPHIDRAVRIAKSIREESSDPVTFPLWKPWAIDMADGIGALAARLEAAERDLADARKALGDWWTDHVTKECSCREVHFLNLCPHCASDERLRMLARDAAVGQQPHPCPRGTDCDLSKGAVKCLACGRNWPPDETWAAQQPPAEETP